MLRIFVILTEVRAETMLWFSQTWQQNGVQPQIKALSTRPSMSNLLMGYYHNRLLNKGMETL